MWYVYVKYTYWVYYLGYRLVKVEVKETISKSDVDIQTEGTYLPYLSLAKSM